MQLLKFDQVATLISVGYALTIAALPSNLLEGYEVVSVLVGLILIGVLAVAMARETRVNSITREAQARGCDLAQIVKYEKTVAWLKGLARQFRKAAGELKRGRPFSVEPLNLTVDSAFQLKQMLEAPELSILDAATEDDSDYDKVTWSVDSMRAVSGHLDTMAKTLRPWDIKPTAPWLDE